MSASPKNSNLSPAKAVVVYTDGACAGNPGPGGFAAVLRYGPKEREIVGAHTNTTNNQMELMAAIAALEALKAPCEVELHTDSQYLRNGITDWIVNWKRNGWKTADKKPVKNAGLWRRLDRAAAPHRIQWRWVRGHAGHADNERVDELARTAIDKLRRNEISETDLDEFPLPLAKIDADEAAAEAVAETPIDGDTEAEATISAPPADKKRKKSAAATAAAKNTADRRSVPSSLFDETARAEKKPGGARASPSADEKCPPIVLASTSAYRRELLGRLGVSFEAHPPGVDEDAAKALGLDPTTLVQELARQKALALAKKFPTAILIGSDQAPVFDGEILDKPSTRARTVAQLSRLAGHTHVLLTALAVHDARTGRTVEHLDEHHLTMRPLTAAQIEDYVARDKPYDCAGGYRIESLGIALFATVHGDDHTAIIGLPLIALTRILASLGHDPLAGAEKPAPPP